MRTWSLYFQSERQEQKTVEISFKEHCRCMSIIIGVDLEEDSTRGIFGGVSGDGKRFGEIEEVQNKV